MSYEALLQPQAPWHESEVNFLNSLNFSRVNVRGLIIFLVALLFLGAILNISPGGNSSQLFRKRSYVLCQDAQPSTDPAKTIIRLALLLPRRHLSACYISPITSVLRVNLRQ